jgi:ATP-binding cassette subfamily F protein 3
LLRRPEVLMLDEPTKHLDLDSVEWLESYLGGFDGAILAVSHDRYFLDRVTEVTWEVAGARVETYSGAYSKYRTLRAHRHGEWRKRYDSQQEYIAKTREFIARHISGQRTKEAQGRRARLERFLRDEAIGPPPQEAQIDLRIEPARRSGEIVLRAEGLAVGYDGGDPLVRVDRLELLRGQRVAIVGPNGSGKTTLLRTLLGELDPLAGTVKTGASVELGYLSQTHRELPGDAVAAEAVAAAGCAIERARSVLGALLLTGDESTKRMDQLSGGQRSRVLLARLAVSGPNLLALDEPTNHLDMPSVEIMERMLQAFGETILFVSHDRYLVEGVASEIWAIDDGALKIIRGGWADYLRWRAERSDAQARSAQPAPEARKTAEKDKAARKAEYAAAKQRSREQERLQRRVAELEAEIERVEAELAELRDNVSAAGERGDLEAVEKLGTAYGELDRKLTALWDQWEHAGEQLQ